MRAALAAAGPRVSALTVYMCWHDGAGHDYPPLVIQAAGRLRERHPSRGRADSEYTSLSFSPTDDDAADFAIVAPYCDLAYATDDEGQVLLDVNGTG